MMVDLLHPLESELFFVVAHDFNVKTKMTGVLTETWIGVLSQSWKTKAKKGILCIRFSFKLVLMVAIHLVKRELFEFGFASTLKRVVLKRLNSSPYFRITTLLISKSS